MATLGTIVVTIGVVNLISDVFLQKQISDDLISLIQSDRRLIEAGLDGLAKVEDEDWFTIISTDSTVECSVLDPRQFINIIWPRLLDAAKTRLQSVEIVLLDVEVRPDTPATGSDRQTEDEDILVPEESPTKSEEPLTPSRRLPIVAATANRLGLDEDGYAAMVVDCRRQLEAEWKAMKADVSSPCSIEIRRTAMPPTFAFVHTPQLTALILEPLSRATGHTQSHVVRFRTQRKGNKYAAWLTSSISALKERNSAPFYADPSSTRNTGAL